MTLTHSREQLEKALSEHAASVRASHESHCELQKKPEEEKELAVAETRLAAVEEFKDGHAFEELFREKSE